MGQRLAVTEQTPLTLLGTHLVSGLDRLLEMAQQVLLVDQLAELAVQPLQLDVAEAAEAVELPLEALAELAT
jgi:hypothetical protein